MILHGYHKTHKMLVLPVYVYDGYMSASPNLTKKVFWNYDYSSKLYSLLSIRTVPLCFNNQRDNFQLNEVTSLMLFTQ